MIDEQTIRKWWEVFKEGRDLVEVRIIGRFQYSGYFKDIDNLINCLRPYAEMPDEQIYFTLNEIEDGCYGRAQCEQMLKSPKQTTSDNNITKRKWVLIDYDPVRVVGTNATEEEFERAHVTAQRVYAYLREQGFHDPVICKSGNGWHTLYRCDMDNSDYTKDVISKFLQSISLMFTDDKVDIDESVFNASRICKLYGTVAKKGANLPERPWRMSEIVYVPENVEPNSVVLFQKIADMLPKDEPKPQYQSGNDGQPFELSSFLDSHGIRYKREVCSKWTKYVLDECFFNSEHRHKDAAIIQLQSGAIKYVCLHNSCTGHTWQEMRQRLDPSAYERKTEQRPAQRSAQRYEVKKELPELGNKWLSLSEIKKIDLSALEKVKTGYYELDRRIVGLYMTEVTILSGSNSSGKSSWLNSLLLNIVQQGFKVALWSGELRSDILKTWIQMVAAGSRNVMPSQYDEGKFYVPDRVGERIDRWLDGKFYLYNNEYGTKWEQIFHDMEELLKVGVKFFALDNLFTLDIDLFDGDKNNKQKELVLQIKDFAKKNQVHILLVAHPRKVMTFLRKNDISGTSDIQNAADNIFIMHRANEDFFHAVKEFFGVKVSEQYKGFGNVLAIEKNRMYGVADFMAGLHYDMASRRFKNTEYENVVYGWEEEPRQADMPFDAPEQGESPF